MSVFRVFKKILELLSHTPVHSVGVNFAFDHDSPNPKLSSWIELDHEKVELPKDYVIDATQVMRRLQKTNDFLLNLTVNKFGDGGVNMSFNFDYGAEAVKAYIEKLSIHDINARYDDAVSFCRDAFDLTLEEASSEQ